MFWLDWIIVWIPLIIAVSIGMKARKYVKGVSDFLAAGRVAGRYVICVAGGEAGMGLISVIAMVEMYYNCGFGVSFWNTLTAPLGILFALTGYGVYRYRETRAMTMGQFLEMRYSRGFRIFAALLQSFSGILNYAIFPAVGARFLIYYLDLPIFVNIFGWNFPTFGLVMLAFLTLAVTIATMGGQITIMVTDCVQGILNYPMYLIVVAYIIYTFFTNGEVINGSLNTLLDRPSGESFLSPYDIDNLRDFNMFYVLAGIIGSIINRLSWSGTQGYMAAAANAHEQKMGGMLGTWRAGFSAMMIILIAVASYLYMHQLRFRPEANEINRQLSVKTVQDVIGAEKYDGKREQIVAQINAALPRFDVVTKAPVALDGSNKTIDNYRETAIKGIEALDKTQVQTFRTIHGQMLVPLTMREMLPIGITGIFCAIMIFLMLSTDTTYMHSWGSILIQDIVLPIRKKPFTPHQQLTLLRLAIIFVAIIAWVFSFFFAQMDYILMFFAITGAIWLGGAGSVIILGLYWKRGTTAGAFFGLSSGAILAVGGIICQNTWVAHIYPWLVENEMLETTSAFFGAASRPFNPYIVWNVTPDKFPVNSQEIYFIAMITSLLLYVLVSLLTCRKPYNMDQLLHRGIYGESGVAEVKEKMTVRRFFHIFTGITPEYTGGDKILAWSVFLWSFVWGFMIMFLGIIIWNFFSPWPLAWWGKYFMLQYIIIPGIVGLVSTFWFATGGTLDLIRLFKRLAAKNDNLADDGRVIGHVSAGDLEHIASLEDKHPEVKDDLKED